MLQHRDRDREGKVTVVPCTSVPRGKSGGRLTPKALRLLPRPTPDPAEVKQFLFGDGPVDPDAFQREEEDA